jgi:hypothetical protein
MALQLTRTRVENVQSSIASTEKQLVEGETEHQRAEDALKAKEKERKMVEQQLAMSKKEADTAAAKEITVQEK